MCRAWAQRCAAEAENVIRHGTIVVKGILDLTRARSTDLMVMTAQVHDGCLDALRGSTTVMNFTRGPVAASLAAPVHGQDAMDP